MWQWFTDMTSQLQCEVATLCTCFWSIIRTLTSIILWTSLIRIRLVRTALIWTFKNLVLKLPSNFKMIFFITPNKFTARNNWSYWYKATWISCIYKGCIYIKIWILSQDYKKGMFSIKMTMVILRKSFYSCCWSLFWFSRWRYHVYLAILF